jgi:glucan phosphorylase
MPSSASDISVADIKQRILDNLSTTLARQPHYATRNDWYTALALAVRGLLVAHWYSGTTCARRITIE